MSRLRSGLGCQLFIQPPGYLAMRKTLHKNPQACGLRGLCRLVCNFSWLGWTSYQAIHRDGETAFQIRVENPSGVNRGARQVTLDGEVLPGNDPAAERWPSAPGTGFDGLRAQGEIRNTFPGLGGS
jgi:hypothetical protein